jgi:hypothetical protein
MTTIAIRLLTVLMKTVIIMPSLRFFLEKKEDNLTFLDKHVEERPSVIMFEEEDDFNYKVSNCENVAIETSSKSSINTSN